jgi:hypothetical protein
MVTGLTMRLRKAWPIGLAILLSVLAWAWWDGGEQPLQPIRQPVELPENWR